MLSTKQSIISPALSPVGKLLAYVSFETGKPVVYVQTLSSGQRVPLANFKGNNSAPAWSPNGQNLAIVLSRDSISQIYTINADGSGLRRVMRSPMIDTEPQYSSEEHTSELQSLMRISYAGFCLQKKHRVVDNTKRH